MNKPYPPIHIQELLQAIGFYSDGFCAGHCEHAPLRESNPELNSILESWHDRYYTSPEVSVEYQRGDISDYLAGEPALDWRAVAIDLTSSIQAYNPEAWIQASGPTDLPKYLGFEALWFEERIIPSVNRFYDVMEAYSDDSSSVEPDPF